MNFKQNNAEFFIAKQGDKVFRELGQTRARRALFMMKIKKCARLKYSTKLFLSIHSSHFAISDLVVTDLKLFCLSGTPSLARSRVSLDDL